MAYPYKLLQSRYMEI